MPFGTKEKWPYRIGDPLKEVQFIWNFLWQDKKRWPLNTGDFVLEVTVWEDLTVFSLSILQFILVFSAVGYEPLSSKYSLTLYPKWTEIIGFIILAIPLIPIPLFLLYKLCKGQGTINQVLFNMIKHYYCD